MTVDDSNHLQNIQNSKTLSSLMITISFGYFLSPDITLLVYQDPACLVSLGPTRGFEQVGH